jgi:hypothetical protein
MVGDPYQVTKICISCVPALAITGRVGRCDPACTLHYCARSLFRLYYYYAEVAALLRTMI